MSKSFKVALLHDWLTGMRGGEKCLAAFLDLYPEADIYTLLHVPGTTTSAIDNAVRGTSFLQKLPGVEKYYRTLLPFFPLAAKTLQLKDDYDLVISTSHAVVKNVHVPKKAVHVSYCFTPMRYIWDQLDQYIGPLRYPAAPLIAYLRSWDVRRSAGVDEFIAISRLVAARIRKFYKRSSTIIYPPVHTDWITPCPTGQRGDGFLYAGALVPYKRVDLVIEACNQLGEKLFVVGDGPERKKLESLAGKTVTFVGSVSDEELASYYARCRALLFPGKEDFGMIPVEVMAAGRPVIALAAGGAKETIRGARVMALDEVPPLSATGVIVARTGEGQVGPLVKALEYFIAHEDAFHVNSCIEQAQKFSHLQFIQSWTSFCQQRNLPATTQEKMLFEETVSNA